MSKPVCPCQISSSGNFYRHHVPDCPNAVPSAAPVVTERNYSDPTPRMLDDPLWNVIWAEIKSWDINIPSEYRGYCGANGNHVTAIYKAIINWRDPADAEVAQPLPDAVVSQPEGTHCQVWNGALQPNGTVYDDQTLIQIMYAGLSKANAEFEILRKKAYDAGIDCSLDQQEVQKLSEIKMRANPVYLKEPVASSTPVVSGQAEPYRLQYLNKQAYESLLARAAKYEDPRNEDWEWERAGKWERHAINAALEIRAMSAPPSLPKAEPCNHEVGRTITCRLGTYGCSIHSAAPPLLPAQDGAHILNTFAAGCAETGTQPTTDTGDTDKQ